METATGCAGRRRASRDLDARWRSTGRMPRSLSLPLASKLAKAGIERSGYLASRALSWPGRVIKARGGGRFRRDRSEVPRRRIQDVAGSSRLATSGKCCEADAFGSAANPLPTAVDGAWSSFGQVVQVPRGLLVELVAPMSGGSGARSGSVVAGSARDLLSAWSELSLPGCGRRDVVFRWAVQDEQLDREVGVEVVGAHHRDDFASGDFRYFGAGFLAHGFLVFVAER